jgi:hypothetical protein
LDENVKSSTIYNCSKQFFGIDGKQKLNDCSSANSEYEGGDEEV